MEEKNSKIKVSIIIPTYKRGLNIVKRAIDSVINQTYENIEIVLVDDNAKQEHIEFRKNIEQLITNYASKKIVYVQNVINLGGALSRNEGINASSGDYITFLDDDDIYLPNKITRQLEYMLQNNIEMSFTDLTIHNEKDKLIDYREYSDLKAFNNNYLMKYHLTKQITGTPTFMYKSSAIKQINGFDDAIMGQEYYLMSKTISSGISIGYLNGSDVIAYRYDTEAISTGPNKIIGQKLLYEYKKSFFKLLSFRQKQYIRCRHYAVMAVAYKRNKKYVKALFNMIIAIIISPFDAVVESIALLSRISKKGVHL